MTSTITEKQPAQDLAPTESDTTRVPMSLVNPSRVGRSEWEFWKQQQDLGAHAVLEVPRLSGTTDRIPAYRMGEVGGYPVYCARPTLDAAFDGAGVMRTATAKDLDLVEQAVTKHRFSPWVADEILTQIPIFRLQLPRGGGAELLDKPRRVDEVFTSPQVRVWRMVWTGTLVPVCITAWFYVWHDQDVVPFEIHTAFGTTLPGPNSWEIESLDMLSLEEPVVDWRIRKGLGDPEFGEGGSREWRQRLITARHMGRGEMPSYTGALLCRDATGTWMSDPGKRAEAYRREQSLQARREHPFFMSTGAGAWSERPERYLGAGVVPKLPPQAQKDGGEAERDARRARMFANLETPADLFATRPWGALPNSGSTGSQQEFEERGQMLQPVGDALALYDMLYAVEQWCLRPSHNREPDGSPVKAKDHPDCRQWGHVPDPRNGSDTLGWEVDSSTGTPYPKAAPNGGWSGMDDQHRSENMLWVLFHHRPSFGLGTVIMDHLQLDKMRVKGRSGAPRAIGRRLLVWAHAMACGTPVMARMAEELIEDLLGDVQLLGNNGPVKALGFHHSRFIYRDGKPVRVIAIWEHALALQGLWPAFVQVSRRRPVTDPLRSRLGYLCSAIARTVVGHGMFWSSGWQQVSELEWKFGEAIPLRDYTTGESDFMSVYSPWWQWTYPAVEILLRVDEGSTHWTYQKAQAIQAAMGPTRTTWGNVGFDAV